MKRSTYEAQVKKALSMYEKAGVVLTDAEKANVEVVDWDLDQLDTIGLQIVTYINTERVCAKEMVLLPYQTCPEHKHVPTGGQAGKEETFRCRYGKCYLYVAGEGRAEDIQGRIPPTTVTVFHEIVLNPGEQYTIMPETLHWFQAGEDGAVVSEFSTRSTDETDVFTDEKLVRMTVVED